MLRWDQAEVLGRAVGFQRRQAAADRREPEVQIRGPFSGCQHRLFVIAHQRNNREPLAQFDQLAQHATAVWPSIHVIAEEHERVVRLRLDGSDQRSQGRSVPVDVTDGDSTRYVQRGLGRKSADTMNGFDTIVWILGFGYRFGLRGWVRYRLRNCWSDCLTYRPDASRE